MSVDDALKVVKALAVIRHLVGTPYVASVKKYIAELTGVSRIAGPDDSSVDIDLGRILIEMDANGNISEFSFG